MAHDVRRPPEPEAGGAAVKPEPGVAAAPAAAGAAAEGDAAGGAAAAAAGDAAVASGQVVMPWVSPPPVYTLTILLCARAHWCVRVCVCGSRKLGRLLVPHPAGHKLRIVVMRNRLQQLRSATTCYSVGTVTLYDDPPSRMAGVPHGTSGRGESALQRCMAAAQR